MAPTLPPLGPRAMTAFGQRTGPALAAEARDGLLVAEVLEMEELILQNNVSYIEEALNVERDNDDLPERGFISTLEAIRELTRVQNARLDAADLNLTSADIKKILDEKLAEVGKGGLSEQQLKEFKDAVADIKRLHQRVEDAEVAKEKEAISTDEKASKAADAAGRAEVAAKESLSAAKNAQSSAAEAASLIKEVKGGMVTSAEVKEVTEKVDATAAAVKTTLDQLQSSIEQEAKITTLEERLKAAEAREEVAVQREKVRIQAEAYQKISDFKDDFIAEKKRIEASAEKKVKDTAEKARAEVVKLREEHKGSLRDEETKIKNKLSSMKAEFDRQLEKLREEMEALSRGKQQVEAEKGELEHELQELRDTNLRDELARSNAEKAELEHELQELRAVPLDMDLRDELARSHAEKAELERQLRELRAERSEPSLPRRILTPSSRDRDSPAVTPAPIPTFSGALIGPPAVTPSGRHRASSLEMDSAASMGPPASRRHRASSLEKGDPAKKLRPYFSPYGSRAPSVFEDDDDDSAASATGLAAASVTVPGQSSSGPAAASGRLSALAAPFVPVFGGVTAGAAVGLAAGTAHLPGGVSGQSLAGFAATPVPFVAGISAASSPGLAAASGSVVAGSVVVPSPVVAPAPAPVGSPAEMPTPVEFIAIGSLHGGIVAGTVASSVLALTNSKIEEWKAKAVASGHGEETWAQPNSKKNFCVAVKHTKVKTPKWPANNYYDPANADQEFACPICHLRGSPCVWSRGNSIPRVLPLPPHARVPGATPQSVGYYIAQ
ncbi:hypothetical protein V495_00154 [Pseudogymnoascus sp. VKM F-4514 (FW-929)]|nr:hypothetical protein V495_00154 [Pseudogymnoascus sp. VKM F-4514 (FW-929)]KFY67441.1 hypothetical protein V497_00382 [Pseudogymnoascus sp. VKM F-4516 (FW-969)]